VSDEHNRDAGVSEASQRAEEFRDLTRSERGGRFVEDEDPHLTRERLDYLEALAKSDRKIAGGSVGVDREARRLRDPSHQAARRLAIVTQAAPAEPDVLGYRHRRHLGEVLVHHSQAGRHRFSGRTEPCRPAGDFHRSFVRRHQPEQDVHQRALARAVLAQQRVDLAGSTSKIGPAQRLHGAEPARDAAHAHGLLPLRHATSRSGDR
jgi:hypothetical protein